MTLYQSGMEALGADEPVGDRWWSTPYGRWRLACESEAMRRFPDFTVRCSEEGLLCWAGVLRSTFNRRRRYVVKVTYPKRFPWGAPVVTIEKPAIDWQTTPHFLSGGRPCLYRDRNGPRNGYDPARTTAATLVAWTALWIHAYETWKTTGAWPGSEE